MTIYEKLWILIVVYHNKVCSYLESSLKPFLMDSVCLLPLLGLGAYSQRFLNITYTPSHWLTSKGAKVFLFDSETIVTNLQWTVQNINSVAVV